MAREKIKRKFVIDAQLQFGLIKAFLLVFFISSTVFFITMSVVFAKLKYLFATQNIKLPAAIADSFHALQNLTSAVFGLTFVVSVVIVVYGGLYLSRKIAGPIESVKIHIDRLLAGEKVEKINFRKGDYFIDLQDKFNQLLDYGRRDKS